MMAEEARLKSLLLHPLNLLGAIKKKLHRQTPEEYSLHQYSCKPVNLKSSLLPPVNSFSTLLCCQAGTFNFTFLEYKQKQMIHGKKKSIDFLPFAFNREDY